jgi:hypothetical protein
MSLLVGLTHDHDHDHPRSRMKIQQKRCFRYRWYQEVYVRELLDCMFFIFFYSSSYSEQICYYYVINAVLVHRFTNSDYSFGIFKLFLWKQHFNNLSNDIQCICERSADVSFINSSDTKLVYTPFICNLGSQNS